MNTVHDNGKNDKSLNDDLDKLSLSYQQLDQDEPPALLDQAILNSAHRAVEKKAGWMQFGWLHGLTTTAVFVLAFGLVLNQREPSPVLKNDIPVNSPARLESENIAKKQSSDQPKEKDSSGEYRDDLRQRAAPKPAASSMVPETKSAEFASGHSNEQVLPEAQPTMGAQVGALDKSEVSDLDIPALQEEMLLDEADFVTDSPPSDDAELMAAPVVARSALKARADSALTIEQELKVIIELKQSGDETWAAELDAFLERHPDYPLPDQFKEIMELKD
jgi:hypothetical protein